MIVLKRSGAPAPIVEHYDWEGVPDQAGLPYPWANDRAAWDVVGGVVDAKGHWWINGSSGRTHGILMRPTDAGGWEPDTRERWTLDARVEVVGEADGLCRAFVGGVRPLAGNPYAVAFYGARAWPKSTQVDMRAAYAGRATEHRKTYPDYTAYYGPAGYYGTIERYRVSFDRGRVQVWEFADYTADIGDPFLDEVWADWVPCAPVIGTEAYTRITIHEIDIITEADSGGKQLIRTTGRY